ncbi:MAG TPA: hydantoinase/oxoprolinase family protein [Chloroflexota bacterium]|nr:hydantoinase/oxoprolinase family protein [Chloroflexota bacterium]
MTSDRAYRIGLDIGGTFTDFAMLETERGSLSVFKVLTTPAAPANGALGGLRAFLEREGVPADRVSHLVHGTTLVANALIERRGATVGLIASRGFRDVLEMRTEQRYEIYNLFLKYPEPLVPRFLRRGVAERTDRDGQVLVEPDPNEVRAVLRDFRRDGVEAIGVCFLHAFRNPGNERLVRDVLHEEWPDAPVSLSSEVAPQIREYERTSTTVANAYVQPLLQGYLATIEQALAELGFRGAFYPMLSSGGTASTRAALAAPIQLVESGPAAGATAAAFFGELSQRRELISFDMGGTTAKICLIRDGRPSLAPGLEVARVDRFQKGSGIPLQIPTVEMLEIGAGGGSIAWIDSLDLMRVGPRSAGADPGPACYGRGGAEPTVTDADLLLGYLNPEYFLGGEMRLDRPAAEVAVGQLARRLGQSPIQTAWAIHQVVNEHMAGAVKIHVIEKGQDPRRYALLAFGGGGPVHAGGVAKALAIREVLCPPAAGVASAIGLLVAPPSLELARSYPLLLDQLDWSEIAALYRDLEAGACARLGEVGVRPEDVSFERSVDGRFAGQLHEISIPLASELLAGQPAARRQLLDTFYERYEGLYRHLPRGMPIELLSWRLTARGPRPEVRLPHREARGRDAAPALKGRRAAYFGEAGRFVETPVYDRYALQPGMRIQGPAIVEERESTTVIGAQMAAELDPQMNLVLKI